MLFTFFQLYVGVAGGNWTYNYFVPMVQSTHTFPAIWRKMYIFLITRFDFKYDIKYIQVYRQYFPPRKSDDFQIINSQ